MSVAVGSRWMTLSPHPHANSPFQSFNPHTAEPNSILPPRNEVELSRETLISVLTHFSTILPLEFGSTPIRLVVHGGACMLLHPGLHQFAQQAYSQSGDTIPRRTSTRDVDIIQRSFVTEYRALGFPDPADRLQRCIQATARYFRFGADWMNSDADIALPMAVDPHTGRQYDPIYTASIQPNNIHVHTIFTSPNRQLTLISVTPAWAVALKLVRYTKWDPGDICLLLRNGTNTIGTKWSPERVEEWLLKLCWPMGYSNYPPKKIKEMRDKVAHAVHCLPDHEKFDSTSSLRPPSMPSVPKQTSWVIAPAPAPLPDFPPAWQGQSGAGGWHTPPRSHELSPSGWVPSPLRRSTDEYRHSNRDVDDFDRSISMMLGSPTHVAPRHHESSEQRSRKLWRKNDKKKKQNDRRTSRRIKLMVGWSEPDDSDDEKSAAREDGDSDSSSSDESDSDDDEPPICPPTDSTSHHPYGQNGSISRSGWEFESTPAQHHIPLSSSPHIVNPPMPPIEGFHHGPTIPHHYHRDSSNFHNTVLRPPSQHHHLSSRNSVNSLGISI